ncbi:putative methyltransferase [Rhodanobacter sp. K2T2]|uniref:class I SAM-dependent methyltransferase n=1 Tax=Rhodanobacter sp. K2T2 TaxID=2723085 RepID=UPI0015C6E044|nr:class I SAM-dependent methyltransferase [Rhodanobacter sp. K2T2]NYE30108.1 putative methyltransferase [Rhodanobacter sp. K2T2]
MTYKTWVGTLACGIAFAFHTLPAAAATGNSAIEAAVATSNRSSAAQALDAARKPAGVLTFLGLKPGMEAADLMTGTGYWAEIMGLVVGSAGHVTAFQADRPPADPAVTKAWELLLQREKTLTLKFYPWAHFSAPADSLDFAIINNNYHDLYWESAKYQIPRTDPSEFTRALYAAMRHGGVVGVIDHTALPGDPRATVEKLHRIDPERVEADFQAAGFKLAGRSNLLANSKDDHTKFSGDPSILGKTDRFILKFVKS